MFIQNGQDQDIRKVFPNYDREKSHVVFEFGLDKKTTFYGDFIVKIYRQGRYRFSDGKMVKKIPN